MAELTTFHRNGARNDRYLCLQRNATDGWTRYLPDASGDAIDIYDIFYATPGRTVGSAEYLRATLGLDEEGVLNAMLAGAPLVNELESDNELCIEDVLVAYERALDVAQRLIDVLDAGKRDDNSWISEAFRVTEDAVFLKPDTRQNPPNRPAAILKQASPQAYAQARELLNQLNPLTATAEEKIDRVCHHWWSSDYVDAPDERKVRDLLEVAVSNALSDASAERAKREATERYEQCREKWIAKHGSQRLKRAAARGYRHDGIYRDERLNLELPDLVASHDPGDLMLRA